MTKTYKTFLLVGLLFLFVFGIGFTMIFRPEPDFVLPNYTSSTVLEICTTLEINETDNFCLKSSEQNADTFRDMLQRIYPIDETSHIDIVSKLNQFPSKPSSLCENPVTTDFGWGLDNCPAPSECSNSETTYTCSFATSFSEENILVKVRIEHDTGMIAGYGVSRPSESVE